MTPAQTITTEWTAEEYLDNRVKNKRTNAQTQARQPNRETAGRKRRQTLAAQPTKSSLSNNAKSNVDEKKNLRTRLARI